MCWCFGGVDVFFLPWFYYIMPIQQNNEWLGDFHAFPSVEFLQKFKNYSAELDLHHINRDIWCTSQLRSLAFLHECLFTFKWHNVYALVNITTIQGSDLCKKDNFRKSKWFVLLIWWVISCFFFFSFCLRAKDLGYFKIEIMIYLLAVFWRYGSKPFFWGTRDTKGIIFYLVWGFLLNLNFLDFEKS